MDLNSANKNIHKILSYIKSISNSESTLYDKSKQKLTDISNTCIECIQEISSILQIESLCDDEFEFDMNPNSKSNIDLQNQVNVLSLEVNKLKVFLQQGNPNINIDESIDVNIGPDLKPVIHNHQINNDSIVSYDYNSNLSSIDLSNIVKNYKFVLNRTSMNECTMNIINRCTRILWNWFDNRILKIHTIAPPFHYDVHRFKTLIYSFVILMGYHIEMNTFDSFEESFDSWVDSLSMSSESNKWVAPYDVYEIERGNYSKYVTLTAVIIWDILLDLGLYELCDTKSSIYLDKNSIWDIVSKVNLDILDNYFDYRESPELLSNYNII